MAEEPFSVDLSRFDIGYYDDGDIEAWRRSLPNATLNVSGFFWEPSDGEEWVDLAGTVTDVRLDNGDATFTPDEPTRCLYALGPGSFSVKLWPARRSAGEWRRLIQGRPRWVPFDRGHHSTLYFHGAFLSEAELVDVARRRRMREAYRSRRRNASGKRGRG